MRSHWIAVARGDKSPDLVLAGGRVLSVFTGEVFEANVAIAGGHIVGVGDYDGPVRVDVSGKILVPGFIDGHCHIESSKLSVEEFARAILPCGTTSVVVDPHELANVLGVPGVEYVLDASNGIPLGVYVMIPSCVPASPFESPLRPLEAHDFAELLGRQRVLGIAELMNYPAAIAGQSEMLSKMAMTGYRHIDGHAPNVHGRNLNAYIVSGPSTDHECTTLAEALEKKRLGMWIMIREASMIRNLVDLLPLVQEYGTDNCLFVTDDREAGTLLDEGHVNAMVRKAVAHGLPAHEAVKLASLNVARCHGLERMGAIAPGYVADILVLPDLTSFQPEIVLRRGVVVAEGSSCRAFTTRRPASHDMKTVNIAPIAPQDFRVESDDSQSIRVIDLVVDQVVTKASTVEPLLEHGEVVADPARDIAKVAVVERHHATGRIGKGFVRGFGLRQGAFASTVAHDAHNIMVVGVDDSDMARCVERLAQIGGGLVVVSGGEVIGELELQIAGLMSIAPAEEVATSIRRLEERLATLGVTIHTPFMYAGFLALSVIPEMRITDLGIVDVRSFALVPLGVQ